jgi:hypothetical protein
MPDFDQNTPANPAIISWLAKAVALVEQVGVVADIQDVNDLRAVQNHFGTEYASEFDRPQTVAIIHRALARAEIAAPANVQGAFIAAGSTLDAYAMVGKVLGTATTDLLMVDPYADEKILIDYARLAADPVTIRVLAGAANHKPTLQSAARRWPTQYPSTRPLEVRLAPDSQLHDRIIIVDGKTAWTLGQSFNALATRAHTSIAQSPPEVGSLKIPAYEAVWNAASPLPV